MYTPTCLEMINFVEDRFRQSVVHELTDRVNHVLIQVGARKEIMLWDSRS